MNDPYITERYVSLDAKVEGMIYVEEPSFDLASPRMTSGHLSFAPNTTVYYSGQADDIYQLMLRCRASKNTKNYYLNRKAESVDDLKRHAIQPYNLVSGDALPLPANPLIYRYMMTGLHTLWVFNERGLGNTKIADLGGRAQLVSAGRHVFHAGDGAVANTSNLFLGLLIDYYQITSGITNCDAQISFVRDPEYRLVIFRYLRDVFLAFVFNNMTGTGTREDIDTKELIKLVAKILA